MSRAQPLIKIYEQRVFSNNGDREENVTDHLSLMLVLEWLSYRNYGEPMVTLNASPGISA